MSSSGPRPRGRPRQFDPDHVLDKAMRTFWELGYEGADIQTLSKEMGLTKPSIYNAFGSKEELFLKALTRYGETLTSAPVQALFAKQSPVKAIEAFFRTIARQVSGKSYPSGCLFACVAIPATEQIPEVGIAMQSALTEASRQIECYFRDQMDRRALPADFDAKAASTLMIDFMFSMGLRGRMGISGAELKKIAARNTRIVMSQAAWSD